MKILRFTFALLLTVTLMTANAQEEAAAPAEEAAPAAPPAGGNTFASLDANSDGSVTLEEFTTNFVAQGGRTPQHDRIFGRWDADGDGMLTAEEFENRPQRQGQPPAG